MKWLFIIKMLLFFSCAFRNEHKRFECCALLAFQKSFCHLQRYIHFVFLIWNDSWPQWLHYMKIVRKETFYARDCWTFQCTEQNKKPRERKTNVNAKAAATVKPTYSERRVSIYLQLHYRVWRDFPSDTSSIFHRHPPREWMSERSMIDCLSRKTVETNEKWFEN